MTHHPNHALYSYLDQLMGIPPDKRGPQYWISDGYAIRPEAPLSTHVPQSNYQTIAPEVGKDNPGTARIMAAIAEDVVDPRSATILTDPSKPAQVVHGITHESMNAQVRAAWDKAKADDIARYDEEFPGGVCRTVKMNPDGTYTDPRRGDEDVRPDPYDGGCPADCHDEARRIYLTRVDECHGNASLLRGMGYASAADVLGDRAVALVRRIR